MIKGTQKKCLFLLLENDAALRLPSDIYLDFLPKADICSMPLPQFTLQKKWHNTQLASVIFQSSHREAYSLLLLLTDQRLKKYLFLYSPCEFYFIFVLKKYFIDMLENVGWLFFLPFLSFIILTVKMLFIQGNLYKEN